MLDVLGIAAVLANSEADEELMLIWGGLNRLA